MLKNTNLEEVKEVFKNLLYAVPIEATNSSYMLSSLY